LRSTSRTGFTADLRHFLSWLQGRQGWEKVTARELLIRQSEASDQYAILDLLQEWVNSRQLSKASNKRAYSAIRSFFSHNRCALPADPAFRVQGFRPPVTPKLALEDVRRLVDAATLRDRSVILVKWQGLLGNEGTIYVGQHLADHIVSEMKKDACPIRIDIPGT